MVDAFTLAAFIASLKVTATAVPGATFVAFPVGVTPMTAGGTVSRAAVLKTTSTQ